MNTSTAAAALVDLLDEPYPLTQDQIAAYRRDGYIKLRGVFDAGTLERYGSRIRAVVAEKAKNLPPLHERDTYGKAFQQIFNLWLEDAEIRRFVFSKRLARIATELMGTRGVRMYHDQALFKEPGGGFTPWHADQQYWPLSSEHSITAWIPLQATPVEMGPLQFAIGSHRIHVGRDLEISDESEQLIGRTMKDFPKDETPFELGEVSFHAGWTMHRAGPNNTDRMRAVMTVIYIDIDMRMSVPKNSNQARDAERWCPGIKPGELIASPINPPMYER